jgi:hypothetical protein
MAPTMAKEKPGGSGHNAAVLARLRAMRGLGESYSDVILRLAAEGRLNQSAEFLFAHSSSHLKPSIHSVSACEPRPSAASIAALYPRIAWSLDTTPLVRGFASRSAR